ncbi:MAG: hypothetical protein MJZ67_05755 [Bacteroidales bacterium]|nr:hypothetical protein [Bacteroidales bacterium]
MPRLGSKKIKSILKESLKHSSTHCRIEGDNPMLLVVENRVFTVFLKPIGDVCYTNNNESTRVQLPKRNYFDKIKASKRPFLLMGFDLINKVFVIWNPISTKERLNTKKNLSFYCRLNAQREAKEKQIPTRCNLKNGEFVWVIPMSLLAEFLMYIEDYFSLNTPDEFETTTNSDSSIDAEHKELFSIDVDDIFDGTGKIVAIKNPAILKELKEAHTTGKPFAEYEILYKHYADKTAIMALSEWRQLLNSINWDEVQ